MSRGKTLLLKGLASAVLAAWILSRVELPKMAEALLGMPVLTFLAAVALYLCTIAVSALRWHLLIPHRRYADLLPLTLIAQYYALISPGQIAGEAVKAYRLGKGSEDAEQIVAAVILDRMAGLWGILILALLGLASGTRSASSWGAPLLIAGLLILAAVSLLLRFMPQSRFLQRILSFMAGMGRRSARLAEQCGRLLLAWKGYMGGSPKLLRALGMGIGYQGLGVLISQILAQGLGIDLPFSDWCWIFGVVSLVVFLPLTVGGIGLREGGLILLLGDLGVSYEKALGLSLSIFALQLFGALLGAVVDLLWGTRRSPGQAPP
jgi:hypothetical protein